MKKSLIVLSVTIPLLFSACKQEEKKETVTTEVTTEQEPAEEKWDIPKEEDKRPLNVKVDALSDSVNRSFDEMLKNENAKFEAIKTTLESTKLIKGFNQFESVSKIQKLLGELMKLRISKESLTDGNRTSLCDKKTDELIGLLKAMYDASNQFEGNSLAVKSANEAFQCDQNDFFYRKDYSKFVREFNELLQNNQDAIKALGGKYATITPAQDLKYADNI